jgi:excisionase family DNA binding protein
MQVNRDHSEEGRMGQQQNLSLQDAAVRLGVSPHTLRAWAVYQHRIAHVRLGRRILFRPVDVEAFEQANRVEARPA